jgi:hypothetical protein
VTLDSAEIPTQDERFGDSSRKFREPVAERHVIDFHCFWSDIMADTIAYFAKVAKEKTCGSKIVGAFYGYTFEFAELAEDAGHLALGRLLRSAHIDFIMAPSSYYNRSLPGEPYFRAPVRSLQHHGKLFWNDFDQVSYKYFEKLRANPALKQWEFQMGLTKTAKEFVWMNRREVGMALAQNVQLAHFDIHGGYYEDPVILDGVKQLVAIRQQALKHPDRHGVAQILVIVDEASQHYLSFRNPITKTLLSAQLANLDFVAPYDAILLSDLAGIDVSQYKLVLVLNAVKLDSSQRQIVRRKLAGEKRTVVWLHAPGYFDEAACDVANMREVTGIDTIIDGVRSDVGLARIIASELAVATELKVLPGLQFRVVDPSATPLALTIEGAELAVVARKTHSNWTSIYSAAAPLPPAVLRPLAKNAGVHLYTESPDYLVFASNRYLTIGAPDEGGMCQVTLPSPRTVVDTAQGDVVCRDAAEFQLTMRPKEVRLFELTGCGGEVNRPSR